MTNKYVYELYKASDGKFYIERKTVIYENSEYIYFKKSGTDRELSYVLRKNVYYDISEVPSSYFTDLFCGRRYLHTYDKSKDKVILEKRTNQSWEIDLKRLIYIKEQEISRINLDLESKNKELKLLKDKLIKIQSTSSEV